MALRLNGSTSGYVELNAPAVAGSQSLTIPYGILQVKNAHKTDSELYTPNTTWTDVADLSVSITPSSSSNNVYITATVNAATNARAHFRILRGSTPIAVGNAASSRPQAFASDFQRASGPNIISASISWLDSPSTTSATTYKIQTRMDGPGNLYINMSYDDYDTGSYGRTVSSIIVMEAIP